jgi:hypothetical protein
MTVEQLKAVMQQGHDLDEAGVTRHMHVFNLWSKVCNSDDVAGLLRNFDQLLKRLQGPDTADGRQYSAGTAEKYMLCVLRALQLPEVQQLLGCLQQVEELQEQVLQAKQDFYMQITGQQQPTAQRLAGASLAGYSKRGAAASKATAAAEAAVDAADGTGGQKRASDLVSCCWLLCCSAVDMLH